MIVNVACALSGFVLTDEPLPRTRLGRYRRFMLREIYARASSGQIARAPRLPGPEDQALLADPLAAGLWSRLQERQPGLTLDLNSDSFAWRELTVALQERFGVQLTEDDIAGIVNLRDLLCLAVERGRAGSQVPRSEPAIATDLDRWLAPTGVLLTAAGVLLYALNRLVMRGLFRLRVQGVEHLPSSGPYVIAPNHLSDLDAMAIAGALPLSRPRRLYWAGDIVRLFHNAAQWFDHVTPTLEQIEEARKDPAMHIPGSISGTLSRSLVGALPGTRVTAGGIEYGTLPVRDVLGSLRADNWLYAHGDPASSMGREIKAKVREAFYPSIFEWKIMVTSRSNDVLRQALAGLARA